MKLKKPWFFLWNVDMSPGRLILLAVPTIVTNAVLSRNYVCVFWRATGFFCIQMNNIFSFTWFANLELEVWKRLIVNKSEGLSLIFKLQCICYILILAL